MIRRIRNVLWLSSRDYFNEWRMSGFFILALAAVLGPMMILFGLKFGIIGSMLDRLIEDPRNREIRPIGSGRYDIAWIEKLRERPEVAFIVPKTRAIAATMDLTTASAKRIISVEMIPSGKGDPLLDQMTAIKDLNKVILSQSAARKLDVSIGDSVDASLSRKYLGQGERVFFSLKVIGIANSASFNRDGAFTSIELMEAAEDFRDGRAVPAMDWRGDESDYQRTYPGFRLYSRSIYDVAPLARALEKLDIEVNTRAADIEIVSNMDRNLSAVFWVIALIGLIGFSFSLGASLWANIDRKRKELSVLRLVGFRTADIVWFPLIQSIFTALFGWLIASGIYYGVSFIINQMFIEQLEQGEAVCQILGEHYLIALALTISSAMLAAAMAGYRAAHIEPSEGLREI